MAKKKPTKKAAGAPTADTRILVLYGPEPALQRQTLDTLKAALSNAHGEVEVFSFDGKHAELADVFDELRGYSLMQTHKLVLIDDADQFVKTHRAAMERYAEAPVDHATLVLRSTTWNRGKLDKLIEQHGLIVKCDQLKPADAEKWLIARAADHHDCVIKRPASTQLLDRVGAHLGQLDSELGKLAVMVGKGGEVTSDLIEEAVGRGSDAQAWAVQEAVLSAMTQKQPGSAIASIRELVELSGQPDVLVTYFVADLMRKFAVAQVLLKAGEREADVAKEVKMHWGARQRMFFDALRTLGQTGGMRLFHDILDTDRRSKSGLGNARANLERFVTTAAR